MPYTPGCDAVCEPPTHVQSCLTEAVVDDVPPPQPVTRRAAEARIEQSRVEPNWRL